MNKTLLIILGLAVAIGLAFWLLLPAPAPETIDVAETTSTAAAVTPTPAATVPTTTTPEEAVAPVVAQPPLPATPEEPVPAAQPAPASTVATTTAAAADESNVVAEVNGIPIERAALTQGVQTIISQYASVYKQMGQDFESMLAGASGYSLRLGIEAQALERLLFGSIADAEVKQRGLVVTDEELDAEFTAQYEKFLAAQGLTEETLRSLLVSQNMTLESFKEGGRASIRDQLLMMKLQAAVAGSVKLSSEEIQAYWEKNRSKYDTPEQVRASHILVKTEDEAKAVLADLEAGKDFATLAREKSTDVASAKQDGDLGWFGRGTMVAEFEDAAFSLAIGQRSGIVATQYGYHIILVTDKKAAAQAELADARDRVETDAKQEVVTERANTWYTEVMAAAVVTVRDPMLSAARQQRINIDLGLEAFEALRAAGSVDQPYLPYIIGTLYENRIQNLTRAKTQLEASETPDAAQIAELTTQIQEARDKAIAAYQETIQLTGSDPDVEARVQALQSPTQTPALAVPE
jgi:parvulin-like peptidyl-prolyl isomerase